MIRARTVGHGLADLRAHPWRACLSGLSLSIGVLAVVAIHTVAAITAEVFIASEEQRNGRLLTVSGDINTGQLDPDHVRDMIAAAAPVTATGGAAAILVNPPYLTGVASPHDRPLTVPFQNILITLVAGDLPQVKRMPMLDGAWFDTSADLPVTPVANLAAARQLGGVGTQLQLSISPQHQPLVTTVSGVVADGTGEPRLYLPLPALLNVQPYGLDNAATELLIHHPTASFDALEQVGAQAAAAGGELSGSLRRVDTVGQLLSQLRSQQTAFMLVAVVALVIAALGILNIGLASVSERARELVIRRAVGATRFDILGQMLVSSVIVGVVAAAVAVGAAWGGVQWWVPQQISPATAIEPPGLPWEAVRWGVAAAVTTTLVGSVIPALVAARLDVATALRD